MNTWDHKGTTITLRDNGKFCAVAGGKSISSASLDAAKKAIDKAFTEKKFEPISILSFRKAYLGGGPSFPVDREITTGKATGVARERGSRFRDPEIKFETMFDGQRWRNGSVTSVILDTPQNRAAIKKYHDTVIPMQKEMARLHKAIEEETNKVMRLYVRAEDHVKKT